MRLLLVEDDTKIGESVLDLLRVEHYAVDWVRDGESAETALHTQAYDLVLLDLGPPRWPDRVALDACTQGTCTGADRHRARLNW